MPDATTDEDKIKMVDDVSNLRISLEGSLSILKKIMESRVSNLNIRELSIVRTKLQEARMWSGESLANFDTDFEPSDKPGEKKTVSKLKRKPLKS